MQVQEAVGRRCEGADGSRHDRGGRRSQDHKPQRADPDTSQGPVGRRTQALQELPLRHHAAPAADQHPV